MVCITNIGFLQCFSFGSRKVSYTLLLPLVRTLFCVFCLTNTGFAQCYSFGSRQVCCMLVFILLYSAFFGFACFASPARVCAVLSLRFPSSLHPFGFLCFIQFAFVTRACPTSSGLCSDFSPAPFKFARFIFLLCIIQFQVCVLRSFPH